MKSNKFALPFLAILLLPFYILVFQPFLQAGFAFDDLYNSKLKDALALKQQGLNEFIFASLKQWTFQEGRLFPLHLIILFEFSYHFTEAFSYQIARLIFVFLSLISFAWLIKIITKKLEIALLFLFLTPLFWSVQPDCDSLISFGIIFPSLTIFCSLSCAFYIKAREENNRLFLALSLFTYFCALMIYETAIIVLLIVIFSEFFQRESYKIFLQKIAPHAILTALYLIGVLILRFNAKSLYNGLAFGEISMIPITLINQLLATLPLTNLLFSKNSFSVSFFDNFIRNFSLFLISISAISYLLFRLSLEKNSCIKLIIISCCFLFIPAFSISVIGKYQMWVGAQSNYGYLPLYMQYFGLSLLGLIWCNKILNYTANFKARLIITFLFSAIISLGICYAVLLNFHGVSRINELYKQQSNNLNFQSVQAG